jgi:hypothetical protein
MVILDTLIENWGYITIGLGLLYPPLLYVLPKAQADKIKLGVIAIRKLTEVLEAAVNTKGGFKSEKEE